jgi:SAM-dependent methyltransferase
MTEEQPWHQDDLLWETVAPILFDERHWADAPGEVAAICALLGLEPGARVLDLCCGVGRHSLEFARQGFQVTGVDRTRLYLRRAIQRAEAEGLEVEFVQQDMRRFCRPDAFDATVNLFTSFGYFRDIEQDRQVARNVHRSLKPGGAFLLEMAGKEILARVFQPRDWREQDGVLILQEREVSESWSWMENRWILIVDGERVEYEVSHRLYSAAELCSLLLDCGFAQAEAYGDLEGSSYDRAARRLVVVARKGD